MGLSMIRRAGGGCAVPLAEQLLPFPGSQKHVHCSQEWCSLFSLYHFSYSSVSQSNPLSGRWWVWRGQSISWRRAAQSGLQVNRLVKESVANEDHQGKEAQLKVAENKRQMAFDTQASLCIHRSIHCSPPTSHAPLVHTTFIFILLPCLIQERVSGLI